MTQPDDRRTMRVFLLAGEASGDILGANLMRALRQAGTGTDFIFEGIGGPEMTACGLNSLFPMNELSVMGVTEVLPKLLPILKRISQTSEYIKNNDFDIVVTIDAPDFSFRVAKSVHGSRTAARPLLIHYVAPTVWAWRPERAAKIARIYDGLLCLLPFEPPYFEKEGLPAVFSGHPVMSWHESEAPQGGETFRARHGIDPAAQTIGVLFGSRGGEFKRVAPFIRDAVFSLSPKQAGDSGSRRHLIVPTLPWLKDRAESLLAGSPFPVTIVTDPGQKWQAFRAMDVACAVSGTVGLELAVAGVPHVIAYKTGALTWRILKSRIKTKYAHLANILLDRPLVPEFIQEHCRAELIGETLGGLAASAPQQAGQREGFAAVRALLRGNDAEKPPEVQAASFILSQFAAKCL